MLVEEFKREINRVIRGKLMEVEEALISDMNISLI